MIRIDLFPLSLTILLISICNVVQNQDINFSGQFGNLQYANPSAQGYRRCAYWELPDGTKLHSTCDPHVIDRCGRKAQYTYKCCSGFEERSNLFKGYRGIKSKTCAQVVSPYTACTEAVLQSKEHSAFAPQLFSVAEVTDEVPSEAHTILAPKMTGSNGMLQATQHVIRGRYYIEELKDGMQLEVVEGGRNVYVSRYSNGMTAFDCVEVTDANLECLGGVIHKLVRPLGDGGDFDRSSVMSLLRAHPDTQAFAADLPDALKRQLDDVRSGRRYTVLAPRAEAWNALKQKYSGEKLATIASSHVLRGQVCSGNLANSLNVKETISSNQVKVVCEVDQADGAREKRFVLTDCDERRAIIESDLTAANGVVHILDQPVVPLAVLTLEDFKNNEQCAKALKITEFMKLIKECDLYIEPGVQYAMVFPTDESFQWWSTYEQFQEEYKRFQVDKEYRCRVARYHIVPSNGQLKDMRYFSSHLKGHRTNNKNDYLYETTYFRPSPYGSQLYFHYSPISDMRSHVVGDTSIYLTPRINVIPEKNISDILRERADTTITNSKTIEVQMNEKYFTKNAPKNLYLVTTDDGWKDPREGENSANPYRSEYTMYTADSLEQFLLLHHIPAYLWGDDIGYFGKDTEHKFMSSAGVELTFWRDKAGVMRIGHDEMPRDTWPRVVRWNLHARDGNMWLLDGVLKCPEKVCPLLVADIDYYDMYVSACQTAHLPNEPNAASDFRKKPTDVASRHPDSCKVVLQLSQQSINMIETHRM